MKKTNLQMIIDGYLESQKLSYEYLQGHQKQARLKAWSSAISNAISKIIISLALLIQIASLNSDEVLTIIDHLIK